MRPKKNMPTNAVDLFRSRLDQIINLKHELAQLAGKIDWNWLDEQIAPLYSETGRPAVETRFMLGLLLLKHIFGLSDEEVCERWVENPYFQYFTGEEFFQHSFPHERSGLSHWRKRLGDRLELLLAESLRVAHGSGALRPRDLARVTVDTTVQPKNITFPTDAKLLHAALNGLNRLARRHGVRLRQSYLRVAKRSAMMAGRYAHAKQFNRHRRELRFLRTRLGRLIRDIRRKIAGQAGLETVFHEPLASTRTDPLPAAAPARLEALLLPRAPRSNASARARPARPGSSASRRRSSPPTHGLRGASSCCTPPHCPALPMTAIRSAPSSTTLRGSPAAPSNARSLTRATADMTRPTHSACSSPDRSAAYSAQSNDNCGGGPLSKP